MKTWRYHPEKGSKLFDMGEDESLYEEREEDLAEAGWVDSPAKLVDNDSDNTESLPEPEPEPEPTKPVKTRGVAKKKASANGNKS